MWQLLLIQWSLLEWLQEFSLLQKLTNQNFKKNAFWLWSSLNIFCYIVWSWPHIFCNIFNNKKIILIGMASFFLWTCLWCSISPNYKHPYQWIIRIFSWRKWALFYFSNGLYNCCFTLDQLIGLIFGGGGS